MGWTEEEALATTMPAIERAYAGRVKMLQAIFGGGKGKEGPGKRVKGGDAAGIKALFRGFKAP